MCKMHAHADISIYNKRQRMLDVLFVVIALALVMFALGVLGHMDYEDAKLEQRQYCERVAAGYWPDYLGTFNAECKEAK